MPVGRCVGCGYTDSQRKVQLHVMGCERYLARYRADPQQCPDPATALVQHQATNTSETRAMARDARLRDRFVDQDRRQRQARTRWGTPADLLED